MRSHRLPEGFPETAAVDATSDNRALELAYRFIAQRERTVAEVRKRLERARLRADEIDAALAELIEFGYVDDARFVRLFVEDKRSLEAWGSNRIARTLSGRGIDRDLSEAALAVQSGESEHDRALDLLARRFPKPPADRRDRERALGVLQRKGYDTDVALDAVRAWAGRED